MKLRTPVIIVAHYEIKALLRSWFFRIFTILSLVVIILLDMVFFALPGSSRWLYYGIPSGIPYLNLMLLNIAQAVLAAFLASDFLKNDYRLNSTAAIYARSMSNTSYVAGKVLGLFALFGIFNVLAVSIALVFNIFFVDVPVVTITYFMYPLIISLPTLIFISGLTIVLMSLTKNQAVSILLVLGYGIGSLFFLNRKLLYFFDFSAFHLPLLYSDFIGYGNAVFLLFQRGMYLLAGVGSIISGMILLQRPNQSPTIQRSTFMAMIACFMGAAILGTAHIVRIEADKSLRAQMRALDEQRSDSLNVTTLSCTINLTHHGSTIKTSAGLLIINNSKVPLSSYVFSLNPGLRVRRVVRNGTELRFDRKQHILTVYPETTLTPDNRDSIVVYYEGTINENACYYYLDENTRNTPNKFFAYNAAKRYGIVSPTYVLLTPEILWYPIAGLLSYGVRLDAPVKHFINFTVTVQTDEGLTAVSQGALTNAAPGLFTFMSETPLPQISLAIGNYIRSSVMSDSIEYSLYVFKGHDYYTNFFADIKDNIPQEISAARRNFERRLGLTYPFRRFTLIETPIQFYAHPRLLTSCVEYVQPEQIFLPEKGVLLAAADLRTAPTASIAARQQFQRGRGAVTEKNMKLNFFQRFVDTSFLGMNARSFFVRFGQQAQSGLASYLNILNLNENDIAELLSVFPMYYTYSFHFSSIQWPLFNAAIEYYLLGSVSSQGSASRGGGMGLLGGGGGGVGGSGGGGGRGGGRAGTATSPAAALPPGSQMLTAQGIVSGLSEQEQVNVALENRSLAELIAKPLKGVDLPKILEHKCAYLFDIFQNEISGESFDSFLKRYLSSHQHSDQPVDEFLKELRSLTETDLKSFFDEWLYQNSLPAYVVSDLTCYEVIQGYQTRYQVFLTIQNKEKANGIIKVRFSSAGRNLGGRFGGRGGGGVGAGGTGTGEERVIKVNGNDFKKVGILLDTQPISMTINTLFSKNIPSELTKTFQKIEKNESVQPFEGEIPLDYSLRAYDPGIVIVDNEDPGFSASSGLLDSKGFLIKLFVADVPQEKEYVQMMPNNPPQNWKKSSGPSYYGESVNSIHYIRSGKGKNTASWSADLTVEGLYDIYYYTSGVGMFNRQQPGGMRGQGPGGGQTQFGGSAPQGGGRGGQVGGGGGGQVGGGQAGGVQGQAGGGRQSTNILDRLRGGGGRETIIQDFHFIIHYSNGTEKVTLDAARAEPGWNLLGTFYLIQGKNLVELTDRSNGKLIYADAVKWVLRK
jgi:hypothetical protein